MLAGTTICVEMAHPDGWRVTSVRLSRGGPSREYLRLSWGSYWIADYRTPEELIAALEQRGVRLADFSEDEG